MAPIIPLRRRIQELKLISADLAAELARRFGPVEKAPPKTLELRVGRPEARPRPPIADREADALEGYPLAKFVSRARRSAKLRLFRVWKLFDHLKTERQAIAFRPVAERLRAARAMLRLCEAVTREQPLACAKPFSGGASRRCT